MSRNLGPPDPFFHGEKSGLKKLQEQLTPLTIKVKYNSIIIDYFIGSLKNILHMYAKIVDSTMLCFAVFFCANFLKKCSEMF